MFNENIVIYVCEKLEEKLPVAFENKIGKLNIYQLAVSTLRKSLKSGSSTVSEICDLMADDE